MNLEPIIKVRLKNFIERNSLNDISENLSFEKFVNYHIFSVHQPDIFSVKDELEYLSHTGGNGDLGIDGLGIKVNDAFITSIDDIKDFIKGKRKIDIEFIFIQSKFKDSFSANEFLVFVNGIKRFFLENNLKIANEKIQNWVEIKDYIMSDEAMILWNEKPSIRLYYVAMSEWKNDNNIISYENNFIYEIKQLKTFNNIKCHYTDSSALLDIIDSNENNFEIAIATDGIIEFPEASTISNSAIIFTNGNELMKILKMNDGLIRKSLFNDNVRAYQGDTDINIDISKTIKECPEMFILFNNGITIVCDKFNSANRKITISNPQIVNGCQTCNVIFETLSKVKIDKLPISIKLIATIDSTIVNQIVRSTNRQNIVADEVFEITREFHKKLEEYFLAVPPLNDIGKIYYERRSKQYAYDPSIKPDQKINLKLLTQTSTALLFDKPHIAHRHESYLLSEQKGLVFLDNHPFSIYFSSIGIYLLFEKLFSQRKIDRKIYYPYKYHLMVIFKYIAGGKTPNLFKNKEIDLYCKNINEKINLERNDVIKTTVEIFNNAQRVWVNILGKSQYSMKDNDEFTKVLLEEIGKFLKQPKSYFEVVPSQVGLVLSIKIDRNGQRFGFIRRPGKNIIFFESGNNGVNLSNLYNQFVIYDVKVDINGKENAVNIRPWSPSYSHIN